MNTATEEMDHPAPTSPSAQAVESHQETDSASLPQGNPPQDGDNPAEQKAADEGAAKEVREENPDDYRPGYYHPVYIGDVYNGRYKVINKIGWGMYSTVWLVEDLNSSTSDRREFRAMKVLSGQAYGAGYDCFEREILQRFREADPNTHGYSYISHLLDDFEHEGPNGKHVCFIFDLYGENLSTFRVWFEDHMIPTPLFRRIMFQLILALDFAHTIGVIHTDIKPDNIFVKMRDYSLIEADYLKETSIPEQNRDEDRYTVIRSQPLRWSYFRNEDLMEFDFVLGDWGVASWTDKHLSERITPITLRSPELLINAPWSVETDFWNLGALMLEMYRAMRLFSGALTYGSPYEVKTHIAEIVAYLGPFPRSLLEKGDKELVDQIFDEEGRVKDIEIFRLPLNTEEIVPRLTQDDRELFVSFLRTIMTIDPAKRPDAEGLLRHPWLGVLPPKASSSKESPEEDQPTEVSPSEEPVAKDSPAEISSSKDCLIQSSSPEESPAVVSLYVRWRAILRKPFWPLEAIFRKTSRGLRAVWHSAFRAFKTLTGQGNGHE